MGISRTKAFRLAKGFRGKAKNCFAVSKPRVMKALQHAYVGRKLKKREFRNLWTQQINAAVRQYDLPYSRFIHGLKLANIALNRRALAQLAQTEPDTFEATVRIAQEKLKAKWGNMYTATQTLAL